MFCLSPIRLFLPDTSNLYASAQFKFGRAAAQFVQCGYTKVTQKIVNM